MEAEGARRRRRLDAQHVQRGPASPGMHSSGSSLDQLGSGFPDNPDLLTLKGCPRRAEHRGVEVFQLPGRPNIRRLLELQV